ncbi:hypothetical protein DS893_18250 [Vibrionales bacterium C3R12]|nr:hypothetical protein [Vibrio cyclitrophicus]EHD1699176.1 hypothetical protein [Vibrio vulnificus]EIN6343176.1 hypothetical protein [Vibrio parahaemolyticus]RBW63725.1 hypothetical protein DS893_18250 [Vibrionales bacterium C3R12]EHU4978477.1 hypothetical protein [Vibrio vulnificus]MBE4526021.1 hypothetical protein [Vibrio parahaemolyticus]
MPRQAGRKNRGGVKVKPNSAMQFKAKRLARNKQAVFIEAGIEDVLVSPIVVKGHYIACVALPSRSASTDAYHQTDLIYRAIPEGTYFCSDCQTYVTKDHQCPIQMQEPNNARNQ